MYICSAVVLHFADDEGGDGKLSSVDHVPSVMRGRGKKKKNSAHADGVLATSMPTFDGAAHPPINTSGNSLVQVSATSPISTRLDHERLEQPLSKHG